MSTVFERIYAIRGPFPGRDDLRPPASLSEYLLHSRCRLLALFDRPGDGTVWSLLG